MEFLNFLLEHMGQFFQYTAFANFTLGHVVMIIIGLIFIYLAIAKDFEPAFGAYRIRYSGW